MQRTVTSTLGSWRWGFVWATLATAGACGGDDGGSGASGDTGPGATDTAGEVAAGAPTITFTAPADGTVTPSGQALTFVASVVYDGDPTTLLVAWTSSRRVADLGETRPNTAGVATLEVQGLEPGAHTITATVSDASSRTGTATLTLRVNTVPSTPVVSITPASPSSADDLVATIVTASTDADGDVVSYTYKWLADGVDTGLATATIADAATAQGELWKVIVTPTDGIADGLPGTAEVTIGNTAPSCTSATLLPSAAKTDATFTCACFGRSDPDPEADQADTCTFRDQDETVLGEVDGPCTLDPIHTERGMLITCELTPHDGIDAGSPVTSADVDVLNSAPTAPAATLAPTPADATTTLTCTTATASTDADGDSVTHVIEWLVDGVVVVDGPTTATTTGAIIGAHRGQSVTCRLYGDDGSARSTAGTSNPIVLANAPPEIGPVFVRTMTGNPASESETLVCETSVSSDADADTLTATIAWTVDGVVVPGQTGATLGPQYWSQGDVVSCSMSLSDGLASSVTEVAKTAVTIQSSLPSIQAVTLTPTAPKKTDVLTCAHQGWADPDGDPVEVSYAWLRVTGGGDALIASATSSTLAAASLSAGERVVCVVTPKNGALSGTPVRSNEAQVENTAPTLASATLTPSSATEPVATSLLTCTPGGYADADGQAAIYTYAWTRNGVTLAATTSTLAGPLIKGDRYRCSVSASDGIATTEPVFSAEVIVKNTLPTLDGAAVAPPSGSTCAAFACTPQGASDPDPNDLVSYQTTWTVNGTNVGQSLQGTPLAPGATLRCALRPTDGTTVDGELVYGEQRASPITSVTNAAPTIGSVTLSPDDAGVGDVVTCAAQAVSDDCTATPTLSYQWIVEGQLVNGQSGATFDTDGLQLDAAVRCRVTASDPHGAGTPVESNTLMLLPGEAVAPVVEVRAPAGADGSLTCAIVVSEQWFINPSYTYFWTVNDEAEIEAPATLTPAARDIRHCDKVSCRVLVADDFAELSSNTASLQMPLGVDCEDGNDCTSSLCDPDGGCGTGVLESGIPCTAADPCMRGECLSGVCQADLDVCVEESLVADDGPGYPGAWDVGGYGVVWDDTLRLTDAQESRLNENLRLDEGSRQAWSTRPLAMPDGSLMVFSERTNSPQSSSGCTPPTLVTSQLTGRTIDVVGRVTDTLIQSPVFTQTCSPTGCSLCTARAERQAVGVLVNDRAAMITSFIVAATGSNRWTDIFFVPFEGTLAGTHVQFIPEANYDPSHVFDAATMPPGSNRIGVAYVDQAGTTLKWWARDWVNNALTTVHQTQMEGNTAGAFLEDVRVVGRWDGGAIIGWTRRQTTNSDVWAQRMGADAKIIGGPFIVNTAVAGVQTLAGLGVFSDDGWVAVWNDSQSDGSGNAGIMAQLFAANGVPDGPPIQLNTFVAGVQERAKVEVLDDDEWVVTWRDANLGFLMTRRFDREGAPVPGQREILLPSTTAADQRAPSGAASGADTTLVAWQTPVFIDEGTEIMARMLGSDGRAFGPELLLNEVSAGDQTAPVVAGGATRFMIVWQTSGAGSEDGDGGIAGRFVDAQGNLVGSAFRVNDTLAGLATSPAVVARPDGSFVVAWQAPGATPSDGSDIYAKVYGQDGAVLVAETRLNATTANAQSKPALAVVPASGVVIAGWQSEEQVVGGGFDLYSRTVTVGTSLTLGTERRLNTTSTGNQTDLALIVAPTGYLAACWQTPEAAINGSVDILCTTFTAATMAPKTTEFHVAEHRTGAQTGIALALDATGQLVVTWVTEGFDRSGTAIQARRFSAQGPASGVRLLANRQGVGNQAKAWVAGLAVGPIWFGWESESNVLSQDLSGSGVYARMFELLD